MVKQKVIHEQINLIRNDEEVFEGFKTGLIDRVKLSDDRWYALEPEVKVFIREYDQQKKLDRLHELERQQSKAEGDEVREAIKQRSVEVTPEQRAANDQAQDARAAKKKST